MNIYKLGIYAILLLPLITFSPFFLPSTWTKMIVLKVIVIAFISFFLYQTLFKYKKPTSLAMKNNPIIWALGLFYIVFLLSSIFSINPYLSFWGGPERGEGFINLVFYGLFGIFAFLTFNKEEFKKAWIFSLGVASFISFLSILSFYGLTPSILSYMNPRLGSSIGNPITFGIYLLMLLPIATSFFFNEKRRNFKIGYAISFFLLLFTLFLTGSRGAYAGFLASAFYFLLLFPNSKEGGNKKLIWLKISAVILLILVVLTVLYATYTPNAIPLLSENRISKIILPRLSLNFLAQEERFQTWGTVFEVIKEKPILGWGLENMSVGFDKHFDPTKTPLGWWDRAHNTFLDAFVASGIFGFISYVGLFFVLLWQLQKSKKSDNNLEENILHIHGMQAVLIGYGIANLFSIESFSSLILFFLILSNVLNIRNKNNVTENNPKNLWQITKNLTIGKKKTLFTIFIILACLFIWQYAMKPFYANMSLNIAKNMSEKGLCKEAIARINKINFPKKILGVYGTLEAEYIFEQCIRQEPENTIIYSKEALTILEKSLLEYDNSSRLWILAGSISSTIATQSENEEKNIYLDKATKYYQTALSLSPKSQEVILDMAGIDIIRQDCQSAEDKSNQCIKLDDRNGACYWARATSYICSGQTEKADQDIAKAKTLSFEAEYDSSVYQLINAYIVAEDYERIAELYEFLIKNKANYNVQWRASLAEAYRLSGQYQKAREAALRIIADDVLPGTELSEKEKEAVKKSVEEFIKNLPAQYQ